MEFISLVIIVYSIGAAFFTASVATSKNYESAGWFVGGLFFGVIALIAICGLPVREKAEEEIEEEKEQSIADRNWSRS